MRRVAVVQESEVSIVCQVVGYRRSYAGFEWPSLAREREMEAVRVYPRQESTLQGTPLALESIAAGGGELSRWGRGH